MLYHTVLIKFPEETPKEVIDGALERLAAMEAIPSVRAIAVGPNVWPKDPNCVWTHGLTLVFDSVHAMMSEFIDQCIRRSCVKCSRCTKRSWRWTSNRARS